MYSYNLLTLAFNGDHSTFERNYQSTHFERYLPHFRLCGLVAILSLIGWTHAEIMAYPDGGVFIFKLKMLTIIPMLILTLLFSYHSNNKKFFELMIALNVIGVGTFFNVGIFLIKPEHISIFVFGLTLTYIFNYTFTRLRFVAATISGFIIFIITIICLISVKSQIPYNEYIATLMFLGTLNLIGMTISYTIEKASRREFFLEVKLREGQAKLIELNADLSDKLGEIKQLQGIIPICAGCKKIRNSLGFWEQVEKYISAHTDAQFSHGLCSDCQKIYYPELFEEEK